MTSPHDPKIIQAAPTKDLFIEMLVKDIPLTRAVIDLVDNCLDGARRIRRGGDYTGLWVHIRVKKNLFRIEDNCGGIPVDVARHYAFRFGRPEGMEPTPNSVGQFGVGMKRAFFKIGRKFRVESTAETSHFVVVEDVEKWKKKDEWQFEFAEYSEQMKEPLPPNRWGTTINITALNDGVADSFGLDAFRGELRRELTAAHQLAMAKGLTITLNGTPLGARPLTLRSSEQIRPVRCVVFYREGKEPVRVDIYVGISESAPQEAGWYVFCNDRMLLERDQTSITGWGEGRGRLVPKYHNQYARFRGYIFFASEDARLLPWNTTKTGVDVDAPIYQAVRLKMCTLMRPVIDFLNDLDKETETIDKPLTEAVSSAATVKLEELPANETFVAPKHRPLADEPGMVKIKYQRPASDVERAMQSLPAATPKEVGEKTFDYYMEMERGDD